MKNKALFLDRDGIINEDTGYIYKIEDFIFKDGIFELCRIFQEKEYLIIVITNQSGIARGYFTEEDFYKLNEWMVTEFNKKNIDIKNVYFCPHHEINGKGKYKVSCNCRKPATGMIDKAEKENNLDLSKSYLIGDKEADMQAGLNAGIGTNFLLKSNYTIDIKGALPCIKVDSLYEIIDIFKSHDN